MLLRSNCLPVLPYEDGTEKKEFIVTELREAIEEIKDVDGNVVSSRTRSIPVVTKMPEGEMTDSKLFKIENLIASGVQLSPVDKPLFGMSLDERGKALDVLNGSVIDNLNSELVKPSSDEN